MPIATIQLMEGRDKATKENLIGAVTEAICTSMGVHPDAVRVVLQEVPKVHWGIGGKTAKALGR